MTQSRLAGVKMWVCIGGQPDGEEVTYWETEQQARDEATAQANTYGWRAVVAQAYAVFERNVKATVTELVRK